MTILITGATGAVGTHLVRRLLTEGHRVRAVTRQSGPVDLPPGVDLVRGDITRPDTLGDPVFEGVDRMFVFPAESGTGELTGKAVDRGVEQFVVLSSLAVAGEFARDIGSASFRHHAAVERAVAERVDRWTFIRPGTFANNLLSWAWPIRSGATISGPYVRSAQAPIHEADVADAIAFALTSPDQDGAIHPVTGPEVLTRREQLATIGRAIGKDLDLRESSPEEFRREMEQFVPAEIIDMLLAYWSDTVSLPDRVRSITDLTGQPARTLRQWAEDHREDFLGDGGSW